MQVKIIRRWGKHQPGETVTVDQEQARWLVQHAYGHASNVQAPAQEAFMPGAEGSDPLASGDGSRQGDPVFVKGERRDNNAAAVEGSPASVKNGVASVDESNASGGESDGKADSKSSARKRRTSSR